MCVWPSAHIEKHPPTVDPFQSHDYVSGTTTSSELGSIVPHSNFSLTMIRVPRTIAPSNQEGIVRRPARTFNQIYPPGRTLRPNEKSLGHDRPDHTDGRSQPDSRTNVPTDRPNGPVDPKLILKLVLQVLKPNYLADFIDLCLAALQYLEHYKYIFLAL
ncbi:unnamed protein product [Microthlaspi erraticum]|uniref:Uncharacterized protein n=1 Tax=Microthlaspi erraticum TaxID=1685480 RepID=A0A6D2JJR0_9BRAS|nr:unnamed protein product [Microthlaspi erraticum]